MEQTRRRIGTWPRAMAALPLVLALLVSAVRPAMASDGALEREQLAALARQIELADRLADHLAAQAASSASSVRARYYFDYAREAVRGRRPDAVALQQLVGTRLRLVRLLQLVERLPPGETRQADPHQRVLLPAVHLD